MWPVVAFVLEDRPYQQGVIAVADATTVGGTIPLFMAQAPRRFPTARAFQAAGGRYGSSQSVQKPSPSRLVMGKSIMLPYDHNPHGDST